MGRLQSFAGDDRSVAVCGGRILEGRTGSVTGRDGPPECLIHFWDFGQALGVGDLVRGVLVVMVQSDVLNRLTL